MRTKIRGSTNAYAVPLCGTVPAEFFCGICGYFGCPGDCWTWAYQPRSELEERLRQDERQRLDFEERVRMQERIDRLEERMWMYDRGAPRRGDAVDLFEGTGDERFAGRSYTSDSEYYGCTDSDVSDASYPLFETDEPQRQRRQSSSSGEWKRFPRERSATDGRGSWIQSQCSLTDDTHRRKSTSSASGSSCKPPKKGKQRKKGRERNMSVVGQVTDAVDEDSDEAVELLTDIKPFRWDSPTLPVSRFTWSTSYKPSTSTRRRKSVSYTHGTGEDSSQEIIAEIAEEELSSACSPDQAGMPLKRSVTAVVKLLHGRESLTVDEEKKVKARKAPATLARVITRQPLALVKCKSMKLVRNRSSH
ncbi:hypothetical protein MTO96_005442 [Rhipicephalus appendiculatus]